MVDGTFVGVASLLWGAAVERARGDGASAIYVSATPSESAVGFYLSRGCRLATRSEINDHLYELEPDDVQLICDLSPSPPNAGAEPWRRNRWPVARC
jgi:hypothetical protein